MAPTAFQLTRERMLTRMSFMSTIFSRTAAAHRDAPPAYDAHPFNVIIFGESGVGKSSVVNLIAGKQVAKTSPGAGACTFSSQPHHVVLGGSKPYCIWDTIGLNEPELSSDDYLRAIKHAYVLIKGLESSGGVHLLLLCMRGRITKSVEQNYKLFVNVLCEKKVPMAVVVTNLENEPSMDGWWVKNEKVFREYGIKSDGHACITAIPTGGVFQRRRDESREKMRKLLLELTVPLSEGWRRERALSWFIDTMGRMMKKLTWKNQRGYPTNKQLLDKLVSECKFSTKDATEIANAIETVRAETIDEKCFG